MRDLSSEDGSLMPAMQRMPATLAALLGVPLRPLQFPSMDHLRDRVEHAIADARDQRGLKPSTVKWAERSFRSFERYLRDVGNSDAFVRGDVRQQVEVLVGWVSWQRRRGCGQTSINTTWRGLAATFGWIARTDATVNPFLFHRAPRPQNRQPRFLTKEASERLLTYIRNYDWPSELARTRNLLVIGLMLLAGLRRGELPRLLLADIDMRAGTLHIREGKGRHGGKDRTAYMSPQLCTIAHGYLQARHAARRTHPELLTSLRHDQAITCEVVRRVCAFGSRGLGVPFSPHALRHTYATLLRASGVNDRIAMELLGHTTRAMLQRYSHVYDDEVERAAAALRLDVAL